MIQFYAVPAAGARLDYSHDYTGAMGWWQDRVLPRMVDNSLSIEPIMAERRRACAALHGRVVELGFGSGLNIAALPSAVTSLTAIEPSSGAWDLSEPRRTASALDIIRGGLDGQDIAEPDASFDSALTTFTLCTIPDAQQALAEVRRVLRPGGTLAFLEHGLAPSRRVARWQRRLEPIQRRVAGGCHLSRDIPALISEAGFTVTSLDQRYLPGSVISRPWIYGYNGSATCPKEPR